MIDPEEWVARMRELAHTAPPEHWERYEEEYRTAKAEVEQDSRVYWHLALYEKLSARLKELART